MIVADNGSTDGSVEAIRSAFPDVEVVENGANLGFSGGNNAAIRHALERGAEWVVLLNNDAEAEPELLAALQAAAERHPRAGVLAGKLLYPDGRVQWAGQRVGLRTGYSGRPRGHGQPDGFAFSVEGRTDRAVGALMAVSREAIERAGLLDDDLFAYVEDVDWSLRIREAGFECVFVPAARAVARAERFDRRRGVDRDRLLRHAEHDRRVRAALAVRCRRDGAAAGVRARRVPRACRAGAAVGRGGAGGAGWVARRAGGAARSAERVRRALVDLGGRSRGGGPREPRGALAARRCGAALPQ